MTDDPGSDASAWVLDQAVGAQDGLGNLRRAMARLSGTTQPVQLSSVAVSRASLIPPPTGRLAAQRPPTPDRCGSWVECRSQAECYLQQVIRLHADRAMHVPVPRGTKAEMEVESICIIVPLACSMSSSWSYARAASLLLLCCPSSPLPFPHPASRRHSLPPSLDGSPAVTPSRINSGLTPFSLGRQAPAAAATGPPMADSNSSGVLGSAGGSPVLTGITSSSSSFLPPPAVRTSLSRRSSSEGVPVGHTPGLIGKGGGSFGCACACFPGWVSLGPSRGAPQPQPFKDMGCTSHTAVVLV